MIVVDSHIVAWLLLAPHRLSGAAAEAIRTCEDSGDLLAVSGSTLYEVALMIARNRIGTNLPLQQLMDEVADRLAVLSITAEIAITAAKMPAGFPRDPFDRIIAATAIVHGAPLVTADGPIRQSGAVATIW